MYIKAVFSCIFVVLLTGCNATGKQDIPTCNISYSLDLNSKTPQASKLTLENMRNAFHEAIASMLPNSLSSVNNVEENADFNFKLLKAHHTWRSSSVSATVVLQITQKDNASDSMIRGVTTVETYWTSESLGELYQLAFEQAHQKYANQIGHYCASKGSIG